MKKVRKIELLAPAKNKEVGIAAINHGADAVYIGGPNFGARAAAGNSIEDITELCDYAHRYGAKVYVALNTILYNNELDAAREIVWELYRAHVDALIIQDMALLAMEKMPPLAMHASTQMDNRTSEKVRFLADEGLEQVVVARELSLNEIRTIHEENPKVPLEVFVHGALCVSYSGRCYASEACYGRSANRGACAQVCRMPFHLEDADGKVLQHSKHLLSLKDMNRIDQLEALLDAGATSLKIEGRLKDMDYVKNVVAAYRQALDKIMDRRPEYMPASSGRCLFRFTPQLDKTFSRGYTDYFLNGRQEPVHNADTPKAMGEEMGRFKERRGRFVTVAGVKPFHNGDGVCFINAEGKLEGFRVNKVEGNKLFPQQAPPNIPPRATLYRNYDHEFSKVLADELSGKREIDVTMRFYDTPSGFALTIEDTDWQAATCTVEWERQPAKKPQQEAIKRQLAKLGGTGFTATQIEVDLSQEWFIPASVVADLRRQTVDRLEANRKMHFTPNLVTRKKKGSKVVLPKEMDYRYNVANDVAKGFYEAHGVETVKPAYEVQPVDDAVLMETKHCIRYALGGCPVHQKKRLKHPEPLTLVGLDGKRFPLSFDCKRCVMIVKKEQD